MPQVQLPIFPAGCVEINRDLACRTEDEKVVYFNGHLPVFTHAKTDLARARIQRIGSQRPDRNPSGGFGGGGTDHLQPAFL